MGRRIRLIRVFPILPRIFSFVVSRLLDFSDYPFQKGVINKLNNEMQINKFYFLYQSEVDTWNNSLCELIFPNKLIDYQLERIGGDHDGGYWIPPRFTKDFKWVTIGLGYNWRFEEELVNRDCEVISFDHTLPARPRKLPKQINWVKIGLAPEDDLSNLLKSIEGILNIASIKEDNEYCLKIDIEGAEWHLLDQIVNLENPPKVLALELHNLLWRPSYEINRQILSQIETIKLKYTPISLKGNNYSPYFVSNKVGLYDCMEATFVLNNIVNDFVHVSNLDRNKKIDHPNNPRDYNYPIFFGSL
jgi:hypothetical protein